MSETGSGFIADAMLGRLAKWLRLAGCDVLYDTRLGDPELVRLARRTGRTLLTRDRQLASRRGLRAVFVQSERFEDQLAQVLPGARAPSLSRRWCGWRNGSQQ